MYDWRNKSADELEAHFNPRVAVPEALDLLARYQQRSAESRERIPGEYDIRFGPAPKQTFDLHRAKGDGPHPILVFIHGGYWRLLDKADHSFIVPAFLDTGTTVVNMNYDLCPDVTLDEIVAEVREGLAHVCQHVGEFGGRTGDIHLMGHSAGAHLAAMLLAQDWREDELPPGALKSAVLLSGIYEPAVVQRISVNADVRLTNDVAAHNDCVAQPAKLDIPLLVAAGGDEPEGWVAQSQAYVEACRSADRAVDWRLAPGTNHFTLLEAAGTPGDPLCQAIFDLINRN